MAKYHRELLVTARRLLRRRVGQRGKLPSARIRRSISTSYYALFHFLLEECAMFFRQAGGGMGPVASPLFAQNLSKAFSDAQAKRHDADYNLNEPLSEADGRLLAARVRRVMDAWDAANSIADKDFQTRSLPPDAFEGATSTTELKATGRIAGRAHGSTSAKSSRYSLLCVAGLLD